MQTKRDRVMIRPTGSGLHRLFWSRRRDSNSQPPAYEAGALPLSYFGLRRDYIRDGSLSKASRASSFGVST